MSHPKALEDNPSFFIVFILLLFKILLYLLKISLFLMNLFNFFFEFVYLKKLIISCRLHWLLKIFRCLMNNDFFCKNLI